MYALLGQYGLLIAQGSGESANHLSIELALLANRLQNSDLEGAGEMHARLSRWTPAFIAHCKGKDAHGFYAAVADFLAAVLASRRLAQCCVIRKPQ